MKLLIVEDEVKIARALQRGLEQERFAVEIVHDGEAGLAAEADEYDVIVLDRMLPGMDGQRSAKHCEAGNATPILMLTAKDQVRDRGRAERGADDYL
jgi:DNA-binding response OmpR family regulator